MSVTLRVAGRLFSGWQALTVTRRLDAAAAGFTLAAPLPVDSALLPPLQSGAAVELQLDGEAVLTGYIDSSAIGYGDQGRQLTLNGRSRAGDLVDCSVVHPSGQWIGASLASILAEVCAPFGIPVRVTGASAAPLPAVELEQGERAWDLIERLARSAGLLAWSAADGALLVTRPEFTLALAALVHRRLAAGQSGPASTILAADASFQMSGRYSVITVGGQSEAWNGMTAGDRAAASASARDSRVPRYRPLLLSADGAADTAACARRAAWEVSRRYGLATQLALTVAGWRQGPGGPLWDIGLAVPVRDDDLGIDARMITSAVTWTLDDTGRRCRLELQPPESLLPEPPAGQDGATGPAQWASLAAAARR